MNITPLQSAFNRIKYFHIYKPNQKVEVNPEFSVFDRYEKSTQETFTPQLYEQLPGDDKPSFRFFWTQDHDSIQYSFLRALFLETGHQGHSELIDLVKQKINVKNIKLLGISRFSNKTNLLHLACSINDIAFAIFLVDNKIIHPHAIDAFGNSSLRYAWNNQHMELIEILSKRGYKLIQEDKNPLFIPSPLPPSPPPLWTADDSLKSGDPLRELFPNV